MRLWSLHPRYLDARGLVALWREGLLAQKVLNGHTRGYANHPQLERFRAHQSPARAIASYLGCVYDESIRRGYRFDRSRIGGTWTVAQAIEVTDGQLRYELAHLAAKLERRAPEAFALLDRVTVLEPHPSFVVVPGTIESWERTDP